MRTYKTIEVTTENEFDKTLDYYAPNVGLVKSSFVLKNLEEVFLTGEFFKVDLKNTFQLK